AVIIWNEIEQGPPSTQQMAEAPGTPVFAPLPEVPAPEPPVAAATQSAEVQGSFAFQPEPRVAARVPPEPALGRPVAGGGPPAPPPPPANREGRWGPGGPERALRFT